MEETEFKNSLTEGVIWKELLKFFFPVCLSTILEQLYNAVDAVIAGNFIGAHALAAVGGSAAQITALLVGFFVGLSSGATVIISQYYGARNRMELERTVHTAIAFCFVAGAVLTVFGIWITPWFLEFTNNPQDIMEESIAYLRIYFVGTISLLLFNMGSGILRAVGDSKRPLYYMIATCVLNIALDILFVAVFKMGVAGAAWATVIALTISALFVMWNLCSAVDIYHVTLTKIRLEKEPLLKMLRIGIPTGVESAMFSISNLFLQAVVNKFGSAVVAAWSLTSKWDSIFWAVNNSFGITMMSFAGQTFGAKKYDRLKETVRTCLVVALIFAIVISAFLLIFGRFGCGLFTNDQEVIDISVNMIWCWVPLYFVYTFIEVISGTLRGSGDSVRPAIITAIGICLIRIIWGYTVTPYFGTYQSVCYSYPFTWIVTAIVFIIYYKKGNWLEYCKKVAEKKKQIAQESL